MIRAITDEERMALNAFVDGELEANEIAAWAARIAADPALAAARNEIQASREAVAALERPTVSPALLKHIEALAEPAAPRAWRGRRRWAGGWGNIAAAALISALIASGATYYLAAPEGTSSGVLLADAHRRSLLAASPVDVLSSDRHTVKPWLDAHVGISPPAPDLAAKGYPLVGGRIDVLDQRPVSTLVYRHNEHIISLVARPGSASSTAASSFAADGYNMVEWRSNGFDFTAVSDLEPDELMAFVAAYRAAAKG